MAGFVSWTPQPLLDLVNRHIDNRMNEAGRRMVARARQLAPVRSGNLRNSIGYTYRQSDRELTLHADATYAIFVEFGTYRQPAQPYLRPAINECSIVWGGSVGVAFDTAPALRSATAQPRNERHRAIMAHNLGTSVGFNRGRFGRAKQHVGRARRGHSRGPYSSQD